MTKLSVSTVIDAPLAFVYEAIWKPEHIVHWGFADATTWCCPWAKGELPKVGGIFTTRMESKDGSFGFDLTGQYTSVDGMKNFSYTLGEMKEYFLDAGRGVDVYFEETDEGVKITQIFDTETTHSIEQQQQGWQMILENFKKYVLSLRN